MRLYLGYQIHLSAHIVHLSIQWWVYCQHNRMRVNTKQMISDGNFAIYVLPFEQVNTNFA